MASTFPAAIANEPPPLDASSEEEDSDDFRSHGLKLDVPSGEPTPVSTPYRRPNKTPDKTTIEAEVPSDQTKHDENEDVILQIVSPPPAEVTSSDTSPSVGSKVSNEFLMQSQLSNWEMSPTQINANAAKENGIRPEETASFKDRVKCSEQNLQESEDESEQFNKPISSTSSESEGRVAASANDYCDNSSNDTNSNFEQCESQIDSPSPTQANTNIGSTDQIYINDNSSTSTSTNPDIGEGEKKLFRDNEELFTDLEGVNRERSEFVEFQTFETDPSKIYSEDTGQKIVVDCEVPLTSPVEFSSIQDDFGDFQSIPDPVAKQELKAPLEKLETSSNFSASEVADEDDEDEFGDFAHVPVPSNTQASTCSNMFGPSEVPAQDFADFQGTSFQSCDVPAFVKPSSISSDFKLIASKIDSAIKSLFVIDTSLPEREVEKLTELSISKDCMWTRVQDFEKSKGLMFKWRNSLTEQRLHQSLNIDKSNIMYHHEKWGIEVPKFVQSQPLDPQKSDAQNSMVNNNNNNNVTDCQDHDKSPTTSTEAQEILRQLPDLSYMRANRLVFPQSSPSGL